MKTRLALPALAWFSRKPRTTVEKTVPRIGLCLAAGGARGLAHVGVIQVLEEHKIPITAIAGTSMGAYVGALWAAGVNGSQLEQLAREIKDRRTLLRLLDPVFPPSAGLIRGDKIRKHLERSLGSTTFADLKKKLLVVATDLETMSPHVFDKGCVATAVHASAAIPGVCVPVTINGHHYTDGGASDPMPVGLLRSQGNVDRVIAVNVLPTPEDLEKMMTPPVRHSWNPLRWLNLLADGNVLDTFRRALIASQVQLAVKEAAAADVVLHPFTTEGSWHDFENFDLRIRLGREAALAALPRIESWFSINTSPSTATLTMSA